MRRYYLRVDIKCDFCGIQDDLDDGSLTEESLEPHINRYYVKHEDKDLCTDCYEDLIKEKEATD